MYAYIESSSGDVWCTASQDLSIPEVITRTGLTQIDTRIEDCPDSLLARASNGEYFHRYLGSGGSEISDYEQVTNPDYQNDAIPSEQYEETTDELQTNSVEASDVVVLTTAVFPPGTYLVEWYCEAKSSKSNNECGVTVSMDGVGTLCSVGYSMKHWGPVSGFQKIELTGYQQVILRLKYYSVSGGNVSAYIRRASLKIKPMES